MSLGPVLMSFYPFKSGAGTVVNTPVFRRLFPDRSEKVWVRTEGGRLLVALDDHVGRSIYFTGDLDIKVSWVIDAAVLPGDTALDIGANYGLTSLRMAKRAGPTGRVLSFEPNPKILAFLRETVQQNPALTIEVHGVALGDAPGSLKMYAPDRNDGGASLAFGDRHGYAEIATVPVETLTAYAASADIARIDFIKLDVEGFEAQVLRGAAGILERLRPRVIVLEEFQKPDGDSLPESLAILRDLGYALYALPIKLFKIGLLPIASMGPERVHDFVAVAPDCAASVRAKLGLS